MPETEIDYRAEAVTKTISNLVVSENGVQAVDESWIPAAGICFLIMRLSKTIVVRTEEDFFIGRDDDEFILKPLVNLAEFDGFAMGVSRRHAMICPVKHGYEVIDLISTNGTWLDGRRLAPNKPYPLAPGAQLRVGREQLLVIYRSAPAS